MVAEFDSVGADGAEYSCEEAGCFWLDHLMHRERSLDLRILREGQSSTDRLALSHSVVDCRLFTEYPIRDRDVPRFREHDPDVLAISAVTCHRLPEPPLSSCECRLRYRT